MTDQPILILVVSYRQQNFLLLGNQGESPGETPGESGETGETPAETGETPEVPGETGEHQRKQGKQGETPVKAFQRYFFKH